MLTLPPQPPQPVTAGEGRAELIAMWDGLDGSRRARPGSPRRDGVGFNRNLDEERRHVGGRLLSDCAGHAFDVDCGSPHCGGNRLVLLADLTARWGHLTMWSAINIMACRRCGRRPAGVTMRRLVNPPRRSSNDLLLDPVGRRTDTRDQ